MSDTPALFFHGTRQGFRGRGGLLLPRASTGGKPTTAPLKPGYTERPDADKFVYVTTSYHLAWVYAWHAIGRGKPRVLTVRPLSDVWRDPEHSIDMEAYRCEAAFVESVDFDPAMTEDEARGGWVHA